MYINPDQAHLSQITIFIMRFCTTTQVIFGADLFDLPEIRRSTLLNLIGE